MACDTFIKIALKCRRQFVQIQVTNFEQIIRYIFSS